jgi:branched-chain amino acid transport system substrate-binding protein
MINARMRRTAVASISATMLVASAVACSSSGGSSSGSDSSSSTITIQDIESLSGPTAVVGASEHQGVLYGIHEINAQGGIDGHKITLLSSNDNSDPPTAIAQVRAAISNSSVVAILGPTGSTELLAAKPLITSAKIVTLASAISPALTNPLSPYMFRTYANSIDQSEGILAFLKSKGAAKVALVYPDDSGGEEAEAEFTAESPTVGVTISAKEVYPGDTTDPTVQAVEAVRTHPDAIIVWDTQNTARLGLVVKTLRAQNTSAMIVLPEAAAGSQFTQFAGSAAVGAYYLASLVPDDPAPGPQTSFVSGYTQFSGSAPDENVLLGYVKTEVIAAAIKAVLGKNEPVTRANLASAMNQLSDVSTVIGPVSYTPTDHDPSDFRSIQINVIQAANVRKRVGSF